jgi:hypothetical protein
MAASLGASHSVCEEKEVGREPSFREELSLEAEE